MPHPDYREEMEQHFEIAKAFKAASEESNDDAREKLAAQILCAFLQGDIRKSSTACRYETHEGRADWAVLQADALRARLSPSYVPPAPPLEKLVPCPPPQPPPMVRR